MVMLESHLLLGALTLCPLVDGFPRYGSAGSAVTQSLSRPESQLHTGPGAGYSTQDVCICWWMHGKHASMQVKANITAYYVNCFRHCICVYVINTEQESNLLLLLFLVARPMCLSLHTSIKAV